MHDFSQKYRGVTYFGLWAEETADIHGQHDAWSILAGAVKRTANEDVRSSELEDALLYLQQFTTRDRPFRDFRAALGIADPHERFHATREAAMRISKALSG